MMRRLELIVLALAFGCFSLFAQIDKEKIKKAAKENQPAPTQKAQVKTLQPATVNETLESAQKKVEEAKEKAQKVAEAAKEKVNQRLGYSEKEVPAIETVDQSEETDLGDQYVELRRSNRELERRLEELIDENREEKLKIDKALGKEVSNGRNRENLEKDRLRACVAAAAYFLQLPYSKENNEVAIATYQTAKADQELYSKNIIIYELLCNYEQDTRTFDEFLKREQDYTSIEQVKEEFNKLPFVSYYKEYESFALTYFWRRMSLIFREMKTRTRQVNLKLR